MNRIFSPQSLVAAALVLGAAVAGSAAHARTDVSVVVGVNAPHRNVQPAPVFVQHQPVQFAHDGNRFNRRGPMGDADRDGIPNRFDRDSRFYDARATWRHPQWGDFDRDGVVNRFDRAPRNPRWH